MILELILSIPHVYPINQVSFPFFHSENTFHLTKLGNDVNLIYGNSSVSPKSSLTIRAGSLQTNRMYQFMVYMENRKNSSIQATGYVLVTVEVTRPRLIAIG